MYAVHKVQAIKYDGTNSDELVPMIEAPQQYRYQRTDADGTMWFLDVGVLFEMSMAVGDYWIIDGIDASFRAADIFERDYQVLP